MIQFPCPNCERTLSVDEKHAGRLGGCPGCNTRFRIPADGPPDPEPRTAPRRAEPRSRISGQRPEVRRPRRADRDVDEEERERRPKRRRRRIKKRRRSTEWTMGLEPFVVGLIALVGVGVLLLVIGLASPSVSIIPRTFAIVVGFVGGLWFLAVAFQDDVMQGLLCLFVPFYSLYYLIAHFEETKNPFFLSLIGLPIWLFL